MQLRIRPPRKEDYVEIMALADIAGIGMSSLPQDDDVLRGKINNSVRSFAADPVREQEESFLFVLEDLDKQCLAGTSGIIAHVGVSRPFYSYKLSTISQASSGVGIYSMQQVLHMVNDYTGVTEIGSLFLHPDYRRDGIGSFLSRCRYMMLAEFKEMFSDVVIAEIRGVQDSEGNAPFYDNLARHFFKMGFKEADYIYATCGGQFIADLMPKYPIYVNLLPPEAQAVIGVPLDASRPALNMLKVEGFSYEGYVDLFDAGPTVQAKSASIRTIRKSEAGEITAIRAIHCEPRRHMISNTRLADFMITLGSIEKENNGVAVTPEVAEALQVKTGDKVRYALYNGKLYINAGWQAGCGKKFHSLNPATGESLWQGFSATRGDIDRAMEAARQAFPAWGFAPLESRLAALQKFQSVVEARKERSLRVYCHRKSVRRCGTRVPKSAP